MKPKLSEEELLNLSPDELYNHFDHLAKTTVHRMFPYTENFASSLGIESEDLYQFARIGLWKGCKTLHKANHKRTVKSFMIQNMRWAVSWHIWRLPVADRIYKSKNPTEDNVVNLISMSYQPHDESDSTFYDIVSNDNINNFQHENDYPESKVVSKFTIDDIMDILNDNEKELVKLRTGDDQLTYKEIAEIYGVTKQCIGMKFKKIQQKVNDYLNKEAVAI